MKRFHLWLRHRYAMVPCKIHCGCNCGSTNSITVWCCHEEFGVGIGGRCTHCGWIES